MSVQLDDIIRSDTGAISAAVSGGGGARSGSGSGSRSQEETHSWVEVQTVVSALELVAKDKYDIWDLKDCWNKIELSILNHRRLNMSAADNSSNNSSNSNNSNNSNNDDSSIVNDKERVLIRSFEEVARCSKSSEAHKRDALYLVCANIEQFDSYLKGSIGYSLCESHEDDIKRKIAVSKWVYIGEVTVKIAVGISIPFALLYAYFQR